ncbi:MAG: toll/interleukin-1 receptor domain-containing protein [Nostoc sp.]|uniref:toll/interleukin-1 receptor domain-containing protein n=1 Tax=Nostoc sp. TaxID=1180 RepID=UPI002FF9881D
MDLSGHRKELGEAIISAYPTIAGFKTMIRDELQQNPDVVAEGDRLDVKISNLIQWAESNSQEKELIEAVYQGNPNNKNLKAITQKLLPIVSSIVQPITNNKTTSVTFSSTFEVFFSYSHKDEELRDKLATHLSGLKRQGVISAWYDRDISAGSQWKREIDDHLNSAQIILLLISADFIDSNYCFEIEMKRAIERHNSGEARVIPIILRPTDWTSLENLKYLQALPKDAKPITTWDNLDAAFLDVAQGIRKVVAQMKNT